MSPHRLTWGAAYDFQFSFVIAILTLVGLLVTRDERAIKGGPLLAVLVVFGLWVTLTTFFFSFFPDDAFHYWWDRVVKTFAMTGVALLLLNTKRHVELLVWALAGSLGYYGIKGGIFTITGGGEYRVYGPPGSMIEENNALAVGIVMVIPLMWHLYQQARITWLRWGIGCAAGLCAVSVIGSWSRGAVLAIAAMGALLWIRSDRKLPLFVGALLITLVAIPAMPAKWFDRMDSIKSYEEDNSANSRLTTWETAFNIAKDRFPAGGGFSYNGKATSEKYSPDPSDHAVAHSIYFQVLGGQGFVGLALFLAFWALVWLECSWIRRQSRHRPDVQWAFSIASMTQAALFGYLVGGAFLELAFWEAPYYLCAVAVATRYALTRELAQPAVESSIARAPSELTSSELGSSAGKYPFGRR
jgi:probable O-glycosylation ligase (exosortase A-associated)